MLVTLNDILPRAAGSVSSVACINVFGFEDARAIIDAAEQLQSPVILATNKDMVDLLGVEALAGLLRPMIEASSASVCLHLDHCYEEKIVYQAMKAGYSSVMFDGSQLPLAENIQRTRQVVKVAEAFGISVEGEIGSVPYEEGRDHIKSIFTDPTEAQQYAEDSGLDALAVAVGNIHRLTTPTCSIDYSLLSDIESNVTVPLVIHGTTGIPKTDIIKLKQTRVAKFNIGTSLRMVVGNNLRAAMAAEPEQFDRSYFMRKIQPDIRTEAERIIQLLA
uniref:5-keto-2-deoxy-D-gluconate-6 phosphate aldolase (EC) n=1 Tax=uncultured Thiotrichaceae bacterium TaxID=298394 RepID=A0A6S6UM02_9GAMM|nr:MAG: 5-keto-2-deoxy-D-gluconate-6 phosphate aldolase (EC [uncultured Thiotrichaceae bacterium]